VTDTGWPFAKAHGTGNDFVLLHDAHGELELSAALVRALCDRHRGIGADGVLRVVPTASMPADATAEGGAAGPDWFMDYRNADGSIAAMCGNGARVVARHLVDSGLVPAGDFALATRSGAKFVRVPETGDISVEMGPAAPIAVEGLRVFPSDPAAGSSGYSAVAIDMGNAHAVVFVESLAEAGRLLDPPVLLPAGALVEANVEFVVFDKPGELAMRVFEHGVGETQSCGTGACAAFAAARARSGESGPTRTDWAVRVPGGVLSLGEDAAGSILLAGPVEFVAAGSISSEWLDRNR
jgi:diaminopimelate epimerase